MLDVCTPNLIACAASPRVRVLDLQNYVAFAYPTSHMINIPFILEFQLMGVDWALIFIVTACGGGKATLNRLLQNRQSTIHPRNN
ncbi:hypothetical protein AX774_g6183 [Zancudomyces culisetae]|uniref:Uncharacterized protein n=1 Tax=Zancudomyces culisetae TaxID=1213189 RepID=A0A1R1PHG8_ZANCU|nr:hypothetical protein AX774_g6183 [Zancudomyces culisetae]|eukprot:OMH80387.1 hypothetical protein AX774_g6183 [Zancudomyces culisetae]